MAIVTETLHIAACNVCGAVFDEANGDWRWDGSPETALDQIRCDEPGTDWRIVGADTVICPAGDSAHDQVRGGESPAGRPGPAADAVGPDWVADTLGAIAIDEAAT